MPEKEQDGTPEVAEQGLPKPEFSEPSETPSSGDSAKADAPFDEEAFLAKVEKIVDSKVQGAKDRNVNELYKSLGDPREVVEAIKAGLDPDAALEQLEKQSLFDKVSSLEQRLVSPQSTSPGTAETDTAYEDAVGLLAKAGLDNDPDVIAKFSEKGRWANSGAMALEIGNMVLDRDSKPAATAASATQSVGKTAGTRDEATVNGEITSMLSNRDEINSHAGRAKLKTLRAELQQIEGA